MLEQCTCEMRKPLTSPAHLWSCVGAVYLWDEESLWLHQPISDPMLEQCTCEMRKPLTSPAHLWSCVGAVYLWDEESLWLHQPISDPMLEQCTCEMRKASDFTRPSLSGFRCFLRDWQSSKLELVIPKTIICSLPGLMCQFLSCPSPMAGKSSSYQLNQNFPRKCSALATVNLLTTITKFLYICRAVNLNGTAARLAPRLTLIKKGWLPVTASLATILCMQALIQPND